MLDIKQIRQNPDQYKTLLARKGVSSQLSDELLEIDVRKRQIGQQAEELKAKQNEASKKIPTLQGEEKQVMLNEMKTLSQERKDLEADLDKETTFFNEILYKLPNPPHDSAPDGKDDEENVVVKTVGDIPKFDFEPKEHWEILEDLDLLDMEQAAQVSGARFYYMKGELAMLQRALIFWAYQEVTKKGFTAFIPPYLTRKDAIVGTGFFDRDENYCVNPGEDDLYLIGTSEVPMVSYNAGRIIDLEEAHKYASYSMCFRREAGSYGKDTKGILRVHQFEKVEMVIFCKPEESEKLHEELLAIEEDLMKKLGLPYQVVNVCCGDLGISAAKKYDIEAWLPGQGKFREMTSTSICTDFQSRRLNIRYRDEDGKLQFAHALNGTAVSSRPLIAIIENYQQADGSFLIPEVLQPFCGFSKVEKKN